MLKPRFALIYPLTPYFMATPSTTHSFRLTLKECNYHEVIVDASDIDAAVDRVHEQWVSGALGAESHGYAVVLDENDEELDEIANW